MKRKPKYSLLPQFVIAGVLAILCLLLVLDITPRTMLRDDNTASSSKGTSNVSETCQVPPTTLSDQGSINIPPAGETVVEVGEIRAGQSAVYTFNAEKDKHFSYKITNNLCVQIHTPNYQLLDTQKLPESGLYKIYVWIPSGSTTFELEVALHSTEQPQAVAANPSFIPDVTSPPMPDPRHQPIPSGEVSLGHLAYSEVSPEDLMIIGSYGRDSYQRFEQMNLEAGKALMDMIYTARDAGIWLIPTSGFRGVERQRKLFEDQIQKLGSAEAAAKVSAPPGYSEHHTGFALDLADGRLLRQEFSQSFANTEAYQWLTQNAARFGFELSFPPNNAQGVSFEPWHWRFVGSQRAATTFAQARKN